METAALILFGLMMLAVLFWQSPALLQRIGCWLVSWAAARLAMKDAHRRLYAEMLEDRGLSVNVPAARKAKA